MTVDKENDIVQYNDEAHKYWTKDGNMDCVSVTTLIHKFNNFDPEFWLAYKAIQALLPEQEFKPIGETLRKFKFIPNDYVESINIDLKLFEEKKAEIKAEWDKKRDTACERGTKIHLEHELAHLAGKTPELKNLKLGGKFTTRTDNKIEGGKGLQVFPELLLAKISKDKKLRIAGQADLIIVDDWDVYIGDYKTNAKIETKAFFDQRTRKKQTMKYPLTNIEDTNFWHYSLQLSTYAWMIEKLDPRFNIKKLFLIHYDHNGNVKEYDCDYLKKDVIRLLNFHKKELEYENFKNSQEKIKF